MGKNDSDLENELDHILDFYSINLDRDSIKKDIIEIIEREKHKAYLAGKDAMLFEP